MIFRSIKKYPISIVVRKTNLDQSCLPSIFLSIWKETKKCGFRWKILEPTKILSSFQPNEGRKGERNRKMWAQVKKSWSPPKFPPPSNQMKEGKGFSPPPLSFFYRTNIVDKLRIQHSTKADPFRTILKLLSYGNYPIHVRYGYHMYPWD